MNANWLLIAAVVVLAGGGCVGRAVVYRIDAGPYASVVVSGTAEIGTPVTVTPRLSVQADGNTVPVPIVP